MLCLARRRGERILIGPDIIIEVVRITENNVRLAITAPREINIVREEIVDGTRANTPERDQPDGSEATR